MSSRVRKSTSLVSGTIATLAATGLFCGAAAAATPPPLRVASAAVASDNAQASAAGVALMKAGGNAIDAACATALALGVVHPYASGIGGGGFALVYIAKEQRIFALDFRERAPAAIRADMFIKDGKVDPRLSREGGLSVGVPGEVRGLGELVRRFGKLPFSRCVAPAEQLARGTARVSWRLAEVVQKEVATPLVAGAVAAPSPSPVAPETIFPSLFGGARTLKEGDTFRRPELARTLARLRTAGPDAFYKGQIAADIIKAVTEAGGIMSVADLEKYAATERTPVEVRYRGLRVLSMPPPSSGGVALAQTLGILASRYADATAFPKVGRTSSAYIHALTEATKHAFADRARHLGDPDFVQVPLARLLASDYHADLARRIKDGAIAASDTYGTPDAPADLHRDGGTAHLSVVDNQGNAVALTTTINLGFGAKLVAGKTGILLNDQMDDFAIQPGVPNGFGLIGSAQNAVAPHKRPLSSMTPTIVLDGNQVKLVVGAAGGPTIITSTTQVLLNVIDWKMDAQAAIAAARTHHQWFPEVLMVEPDLPRDVADGLTKRGHKIREIPHIGVSNLIVRAASGAGWEVAAEPRSPSTPAGY
ncbi:MAG: gamma-glutamyltransferase [Deltaproteobacteria bacterium]|nr:gamma-glutamyltransferase [Deltaproteobacteria bacterium]